MAAHWRHPAAAWAIMLTICALALGVSALTPEGDLAQPAPAWRSVDQRAIGKGVHRFAPAAIEMDD